MRRPSTAAPLPLRASFFKPSPKDPHSPCDNSFNENRMHPTEGSDRKTASAVEVSLLYMNSPSASHVQESAQRDGKYTALPNGGDGWKVGRWYSSGGRRPQLTADQITRIRKAPKSTFCRRQTDNVLGFREMEMGPRSLSMRSGPHKNIFHPGHTGATQGIAGMPSCTVREKESKKSIPRHSASSTASTATGLHRRHTYGTVGGLNRSSDESLGIRCPTLPSSGGVFSVNSNDGVSASETHGFASVNLHVLQPGPKSTERDLNMAGETSLCHCNSCKENCFETSCSFSRGKVRSKSLLALNDSTMLVDSTSDPRKVRFSVSRGNAAITGGAAMGGLLDVSGWGSSYLMAPRSDPTRRMSYSSAPTIISRQSARLADTLRFGVASQMASGCATMSLEAATLGAASIANQPSDYYSRFDVLHLPESCSHASAHILGAVSIADAPLRNFILCTGDHESCESQSDSQPRRFSAAEAARHAEGQAQAAAREAVAAADTAAAAAASAAADEAEAAAAIAGVGLTQNISANEQLKLDSKHSDHQLDIHCPIAPPADESIRIRDCSKEVTRHDNGRKQTELTNYGSSWTVAGLRAIPADCAVGGLGYANEGNFKSRSSERNGWSRGSAAWKISTISGNRNFVQQNEGKLSDRYKISLKNRGECVSDGGTSSRTSVPRPQGQSEQHNNVVKLPNPIIMAISDSRVQSERSRTAQKYVNRKNNYQDCEEDWNESLQNEAEAAAAAAAEAVETTAWYHRQQVLDAVNKCKFFSKHQFGSVTANSTSVSGREINSNPHLGAPAVNKFTSTVSQAEKSTDTQNEPLGIFQPGAATKRISGASAGGITNPPSTSGQQQRANGNSAWHSNGDSNSKSQILGWQISRRGSLSIRATTGGVSSDTQKRREVQQIKSHLKENIQSCEDGRAESGRIILSATGVGRAYLKDGTGSKDGTGTILSTTKSLIDAERSIVPPCDVQFGGLMVRLIRKLSARCHCQFDVWEAEAIGIADKASAIAAANAALSDSPSDGKSKREDESTSLGQTFSSPLEDPLTLGTLHACLFGLGKRFAIKLLELDRTDQSRLKYKAHSVTQEGKQLKDLTCQLWAGRATAALASSKAITAQQRLQLLQLLQEPMKQHPELLVRNIDRSVLPQHLLPIPRYLWTAKGIMGDGCRVLGVGMERIEGRTLTQVLQQMRVPSKPSAALLVLEICIKFVRSQKILACDIRRPLINWDTKPGNVLVELTRSPNALHCLRCVIIDVGDALPGPSFLFPTRHQPGVTPAYVICTKGSCSPECAILVFLLASGSKSESFRKAWYGDVESQRMAQVRKDRLTHRWESFLRHGHLRRKTYFVPQPPLSDGQTSLPAERSYWEVRFSEASVVFSTGLVIAQLMGGPNLIHVVDKNDVLVLDMLCEWGAEDGLNFFSKRKNLGPSALMPKTGIFAEEPWRSLVAEMLNKTLAFSPENRWSFQELENYLVDFHASFKKVMGLASSNNKNIAAIHSKKEDFNSPMHYLANSRQWKIP